MLSNQYRRRRRPTQERISQDSPFDRASLPTSPHLLMENVSAPPGAGDITEAPLRMKRRERENSRGTTIGFWLIPDDDSGGYLKLKIQQSYHVEVEGEIQTRYLDVPGFDPGDPYPIWAVLQNRRLLMTHFRWMKALTGDSGQGGKEALYDPEDEDHEEAAEHLVSGLCYRGWRFFVRQGDEAWFGFSRRAGRGRVDPTLIELFREASGLITHQPANVKVDMEGINRITILGSEGRRTRVIEREELDKIFSGFQRYQDEADKAREEADGGLSLEDELEEALQGSEKWNALRLLIIHVRRVNDLYDLNSEVLHRVLSAPFVKRHWRAAVQTINAPENEAVGKLSRLISAYAELLKEDEDETLDWRQYPPELNLKLGEAQISERLNYDELWRQTAANGAYRRGGMKRVNGAWVYDPTVKGRTQNGRRFVTVAAPKPTRTADGRMALTWRYQSKPARNTTGMSHVGHIVFIDHEAFMKTASRNLRKALIGTDVHVKCSCPDFTYRSHWVLAQNDAAPKPSGLGNQPPDKTNPDHRVYLCKHLSAISPMLVNVSPTFRKGIAPVLSKMQGGGTIPRGAGQSPAIRPGAKVSTGTKSGTRSATRPATADGVSPDNTDSPPPSP